MADADRPPSALRDLVSSIDWAVDAQGYLLDWRQWQPAFAQDAAARLGITLTADHWELLDLLRAHYSEFLDAPPMRLLTRLVTTRLGVDKGNSRHLYRLFPDGPAKQGSLLAGLPKPVSCI